MRQTREIQPDRCNDESTSSPVIVGTFGENQVAGELNGNIIIVRGCRTINGSQIVLTKSSETARSNENKLLALPADKPENSSSMSILVQETAKEETPLDVKSVRKFAGGVPILLYTANHDNGSSSSAASGSGRILIQRQTRPVEAQVYYRQGGVRETADTAGPPKQILPEHRSPLETAIDTEDAASTISRAIAKVTTSDGEPIKLPENLESLPRADHFPTQRHRWNTNEEIAAILISFDRHAEWQSKEVKIRPKSGSMLLYSRKKVRYRRDGYCWKKRKDGKTTREDHMKLKVQGTECIYGCYVHSAILPTFHRRCYWLLQNPDIVLVHYLNVPYPDDNKLAVITPSLALWGDKKEWTKEELVSQLRPMFFSEDEPDLNNELEISTAETVEAIVSQLMEKQRVARQAALVKQLECGCPDSTCSDGKSCSHPMRRISAAKGEPQAGPSDNNNQVSSTTGSGALLASSPRVYSREARPAATPPLVLSLSQLQSAGGLLILNSSGPAPTANCGAPHVSPVSVASLMRNPRSKAPLGKIFKQEVVEVNGRASSCCQQPSASSGSSSSEDSSVSRMDVTNGNGSPLSRQSKLELGMSSAPSTPSKHMDTSNEDVELKQGFCSDTVVLLGAKSESDSASVISGGFFNETLDLSQEDIQRTLSANMPLCSAELGRTDRHGAAISHRNSVIATKQVQDDVIVSEINPMDFIDNCDVVVSPTHVVDDDVFVNLDAFDMLGEFPELEVLEGGPPAALIEANTSDGPPSAEKTSEQASPHAMDYREGTANITDYSPEWAYPEGGVKVLVTGPWYSTTSPYTVLFDTFPVPTTLVQSGVLRCYCPAHEAGLATLQVACEGFVISNSVIFEYKLPPNEERATASEPKVERSNDNLLKFTLLQRLEAMDDRLQIKQEPEGSDLVEDSVLFSQSNFEDRLVNYCQTLTSRPWLHGEELSVSWFSSHKNMTLLHLAASLGYSKLVCSLLHWRAENSSLLLETEVDALSQDEDGNTPLMWACMKGHTDTALMLYRWNHTASNIRNSHAQTASECARAHNHNDLAKELESLGNKREQITMLLHTNNASQDSISTLSSPVSPASSVLSAASSHKSHDGVFLRPGAVVRSNSTTPSPLCTDSSGHKGPSLGVPLQKMIKRPSVDSGINMTGLDNFFIRAKSSKSRDVFKLFRSDRSMSLPLSSPSCGNDVFESSLSDIIRKSPSRRMDFALCEVAAGPRSHSPLIDVEAVSDDESEGRHSGVGDQDVRVLTLAEQIIAAIPERIKNESEEMLMDQSPSQSCSITTSENLNDVFMEPLLDHTSSGVEPNDFVFEFSDHSYRYYDVSTPCSSLSPASSSCLQSPSSFTLDSPSPPPTTADFCEFFQASGTMFEKEFSNLTLSDKEQRELYEAAKVIQKAYRSYKGRQKLEEQDKERAAAVIIQNYYRRYKQYAYFKEMTKAAKVIQNGFRSYCEHKRFKKNQEAAMCIQNYYRNYREQGGQGSREGTPTLGQKRALSQRRQNQAARKIQQFMRQSKNKLQKERAEREKLEGRSLDAHRK